MLKRLFVLLPLAVVLSACGSFPKIPPLSEYRPDTGYRFDNLTLTDRNTDSLFVAVVFSGGGTRAASLSYGVMQALRNTPIRWKGQDKSLLDEVDIVSSVSGGSFTAAYYALHREQLFDGTFEADFLKADIQKALLGQAFKPSNWFKLAGGSYGRSDLAAEYYNDNLFGDATYEDLIERGTRPFLMVNATDMTTGRQFPFIQDQFDMICSDLSGLSIARAVASSSAFPGLLTPLTYRNRAESCDYREPPWVKLALEDRRSAPQRALRAESRRSYYRPQPWEPERPYIHLIDGGVADNIGLRSILYAMETTDPAYSLLRKVNLEEIEKLAVIVVNAATHVDSDRDASPDVPGTVEVLTTAANVPLDNFSYDTIDRLRSTVAEYNGAVRIRKQCQAVLDRLCPGETLPGGDLYEFDLYTVQVAFDFIQDPRRRHKFKNLPTTFSLPAGVVDDLQSVGKELLRNDGQFKQLVSDLSP